MITCGYSFFRCHVEGTLKELCHISAMGDAHPLTNSYIL